MLRSAEEDGEEDDEELELLPPALPKGKQWLDVGSVATKKRRTAIEEIVTRRYEDCRG